MKILSDGHCVTHKSGVQDASRRACSDAKQIFTEHTSYRQVLIFLSETKGRFTIWSLKGALVVLVIALVEAIWGLVGNEMAHVPTVTSLSTQRRVGVYTNLNLD